MNNNKPGFYPGFLYIVVLKKTKNCKKNKTNKLTLITTTRKKPKIS